MVEYCDRLNGIQISLKKQKYVDQFFSIWMLSFSYI